VKTSCVFVLLDLGTMISVDAETVPSAGEFVNVEDAVIGKTKRYKVKEVIWRLLTDLEGDTTINQAQVMLEF